MKSGRRLPLRVAVLCVAACLGQAFAAPATDTLVVPGQRVGPISLGESIEAVTKRMGTGQVARSKDFTNLLYPGFTVVLNNEGKQTVRAIVVTDPPYHLSDGIGCGTLSTKVAQVLGKPDSVQVMKGQTNGMIDKSVSYTRLGLSIAFARGKVVQISIAPRTSH